MARPAVRPNGRRAPAPNIPGVVRGRYLMLTGCAALGSAGRDEARVSGTNAQGLVANVEVSVASGRQPYRTKSPSSLISMLRGTYSGTSSLYRPSRRPADW